MQNDFKKNPQSWKLLSEEYDEVNYEFELKLYQKFIFEDNKNKYYNMKKIILKNIVL